MFKSNLVMMAMGKPKNITPEDFKKLLVLLDDNPDLVLSLNRKKVVLFSLGSTIRIRKEVWPTVEEFAREFDVPLVKVSETKTFHIARTNDKDNELLERVSATILALGITQEKEESACGTCTSTDGPEAIRDHQESDTSSQKTEKSSRKEKKKSASGPTTKRNGQHSSVPSKKPANSVPKTQSSAETASSSSDKSTDITKPRRSSKRTKSSQKR